MTHMSSPSVPLAGGRVHAPSAWVALDAFSMVRPIPGQTNLSKLMEAPLDAHPLTITGRSYQTDMKPMALLSAVLDGLQDSRRDIKLAGLRPFLFDSCMPAHIATLVIPHPTRGQIQQVHVVHADHTVDGPCLTYLNGSAVEAEARRLKTEIIPILQSFSLDAPVVDLRPRFDSAS